MAALLTGNITSTISLNLHFRLSSIPWLKRSTTTLCLKGRDYNSASVPVRYIPKISSSKSNETEKSSTKPFRRRVCDKRLVSVGRAFGLEMKAQYRKNMCKESSLLGDIPHAQKNGRTVIALSNLEINNNFGVLDDEVMEEPNEISEELGIQEESDTCKQNIQVGKIMQDAGKSAIDLLATRAFTAVELRKKLLGKRFPPDVVEGVVTNFQSRGLINDSLYAETFSRSRFSSSSWGPRRIKQALLKKGISEAATEKALKLVFKEGEYGDQELKHGLSKLSMDHLLVQASKQWLRGQDAPQETRKSRIVRWLQYRGFNWDVISFVLKKLESHENKDLS